MKTRLQDVSLSALVAGFIATLISYAGPLVIIFQAAHSAQLSAAELSSWVWAISIGSGLLGVILSLRYRVPLVIAWSAPGSALLVALLPGVAYAEAVGAYLVANLVILLVGLSGAFDRIVGKLPSAISAAMLAGILFSFGTGLFVSLKSQPALVMVMFVTYLLFKRLAARYAVLAVLVCGVSVAVLSGELDHSALVIGLATPVWTTPAFSWHALLSISLPLVMVALTGQFVPGIAVLRNDGYRTPASPIISSNALVSLLLAPFGCHGLNLAAITAAICTGRESHDDPGRRYWAGVCGGVFYLLLGLFGATLVSLFTAFPAALIAALAGLALFGAIAGALTGAMSVPSDREAALITFLVTASGMSFLGLSAAFWGLIFGLFAHLLLNLRRRAPQAGRAGMQVD
ncbi:benzoate/H(+) symporter BenE family transporter [Pseudomonas rubra]|uniref:Benzoate/H(+) symporter BenE family transporter n=1 Tax=Pseudomonas rubra TaxID=2942627 RepID=A0ABT5PDT9_9PSED|nr:benzoate/H(+) symporter BenE family transporter [Pseudomonas rubra]MDD1016203.1 benzoate/H(+) symporter BenE family transporter [Pseudomonas rubra]MDD1039874.1 benzoate/H(+) symporter BenE family transporter [Pseudomonas rubra]MDD1156173.1 benzoate/H(+) symporter BenE family transporter [Pseudomonas rubra]